MKDCGVIDKAIFTMNGVEAIKSAKERIDSCLSGWNTS